MWVGMHMSTCTPKTHKHDPKHVCMRVRRFVGARQRHKVTEQCSYTATHVGIGLVKAGSAGPARPVPPPLNHTKASNGARFPRRHHVHLINSD